MEWWRLDDALSAWDDHDREDIRLGVEGWADGEAELVISPRRRRDDGSLDVRATSLLWFGVGVRPFALVRWLAQSPAWGLRGEWGLLEYRSDARHASGSAVNRYDPGHLVASSAEACDAETIVDMVCRQANIKLVGDPGPRVQRVSHEPVQLFEQLDGGS